MLAQIKSAALLGIDAKPVIVEVDAHASGLPGETLVGLPDTVIRESKNRIKTALKYSNYSYPLKFYTINLAPADLPKEGPLFDVPIALGLLHSTGQIELDLEALYVGELSLNGDVKPIKGILSICHMAQQMGIKKVFLPYDNAAEASLIAGVTLYPIKHLKDIETSLLKGHALYPTPAFLPVVEDSFLELGDVNGQWGAKRILEIAAAGQHNVLFVGPPGSGKTMLLKRLPSVLPELSLDEAIETYKLHSLAKLGNLLEKGSKSRPFRSPHHSVSYAGLVGGGSMPTPGEISLAHNGVLFLDELAEFPRHVLEVLRQPLEDKVITISRSTLSVTFPANFLLIGAMNPCPCGYYNDTVVTCTCKPEQISKYWKKISGPILDRIDLVYEVPRLASKDLAQSKSSPGIYTSTLVKERVLQARKRQHSRFKANKTNALMTASELAIECPLTPGMYQLLGTAVDKGVLTGRSYSKVVKVARTIADLEGAPDICMPHLMEAMQYRKKWL